MRYIYRNVKRDLAVFAVGGATGMVARMLTMRIRELLERRNETPRGASVAAGLHPDTIRNILRGRSKAPQLDTMEALARHFGVSVGYLSGAEAQERITASRLPLMKGLKTLPVMGRAAAGAWIEADAIGGDPIGYAPMVADDRYPTRTQWAELIEGDSINLVIPSGGFAHVVDARGLDIPHRAFVLVERRRGGLVERTVKQFLREEGGVVLRGRSSIERFNVPLHLGDANEVEIVIIGLVLGHYVPLDRYG